MPKPLSLALIAGLRAHPFANKAIPILDLSLSTVGRTAIPVDGDDPRIQEPLVDVHHLGIEGESYYARIDGLNLPYGAPVAGAIPEVLLREGAVQVLAAADRDFRDYGLRLFVLDGYRPIATQLGLWNFFYDRFRAANPILSPAELEGETLKFVSDPRGFDRLDQRTWPLHSTGGAVDVTLVAESGEWLEFGTAFDDATEMAVTAYFECQLAIGKIHAEEPRLISRRILYWTMINAGLTNYAGEWWHFDYGNQMHIFSLQLLDRTVAPGKAWYGYVDYPSLTKQ